MGSGDQGQSGLVSSEVGEWSMSLDWALSQGSEQVRDR